MARRPAIGRVQLGIYLIKVFRFLLKREAGGFIRLPLKYVRRFVKMLKLWRRRMVDLREPHLVGLVGFGTKEAAKEAAVPWPTDLIRT